MYFTELESILWQNRWHLEKGPCLLAGTAAAGGEIAEQGSPGYIVKRSWLLGFAPPE